LIKQFVKALDSDDECFQHIVSAFPKFSFDKIKAGVFDGPQIRSLASDEEFVNKMNDKGKVAWISFVAVTRNFLVKRHFCPPVPIQAGEWNHHDSQGEKRLCLPIANA